MHIEENSALLNITRRFTEGNLIHSFIQAISIAPLQVRGAPDTTRILCRSFTCDCE